jgi:polysaccharide pyruvyl transferase WcaK-like protein
MLEIVGVSFLAKLLRNKVVWLSMGFGPFLRRPTRWITKVGVKLCDCVTVRDEISGQEIASWVPAHKLKLTFDLSALLLLCDRLAPRATTAPREKSMILGVSATSVERARTGGPTANDFFWGQMVHALADVFSVSQDLRVRVFVMGTEKRQDDTHISARIHDALSSVDPTRVQLVAYQSNPLDTLVKMAECRAFIATRFHAALLAYLAGCDLFLVAYHRKLNDLANELRLSQQACVPVSSDISEAILRAKIAELIRGAPWSRPRLPVQEAVRRACLNIDVLKEILISPKRRH